MNDKTSALEKAFLNRQQARLLKLHTELSSTTEADELEERGVQDQALGEAHEPEDDAQRLSLLETEGTLIRRNIRRLPMIERALEKIKDGTYGFSDVSGKPIPRDRLEAMPEAIYTADEEGARRSVR
jgi:DnaK suppressor protein